MKKHFLILALLLSSPSHAEGDCDCQIPRKVGPAATIAQFGVEAAAFYQRLCLDVWCEGYWKYEFDGVSCTEGEVDMDCTFSLYAFDPNNSSNDSAIVCSLEGLPKISLPATGEDVYKYLKQDDVYLVFDATCIQGHQNYWIYALEGSDGKVLELPMKK